MNIIAPVFFVTVIGAVLMLLSVSGLPAEDRRRLLVVMGIGLAVRLTVTICLELFPRFRLFHEDASGYELNAMAFARSWQGLAPPINISWGSMLNRGYLFFGAGLCYLFGAYPMQLAAWNGLFGVLTVAILYRLALLLFHQAVAYRAALLLAFMPSMIVWDSVAIKDPLMVLLISVSLYLYMLLRQRWSVVLILLLAAAVSAAFFVRFYIAYFLILSILGTVVVGRAREGVSRMRNLLVVLGIAIVVGVTGLSKNFSEGLELATLEQVATYRVGMASTARSGFAYDLDVSSPSGALKALPIGLAVVFFGPFPWQMRGLLPRLMLPEMLLWWYLVPSLWRGLLFAARRNFTRTSPVFVFCASLAIAYSLTLGNVGAAVRQRAQIFVLLFVFVALGQYVKHCQVHKVPVDLLLRGPR